MNSALLKPYIVASSVASLTLWLLAEPTLRPSWKEDFERINYFYNPYAVNDGFPDKCLSGVSLHSRPLGVLFNSARRALWLKQCRGTPSRKQNCVPSTLKENWCLAQSLIRSWWRQQTKKKQGFPYKRPVKPKKRFGPSSNKNKEYIEKGKIER